MYGCDNAVSHRLGICGALPRFVYCRKRRAFQLRSRPHRMHRSVATVSSLLFNGCHAGECQRRNDLLLDRASGQNGVDREILACEPTKAGKGRTFRPRGRSVDGFLRLHPHLRKRHQHCAGHDEGQSLGGCAVDDCREGDSLCHYYLGNITNTLSLLTVWEKEIFYSASSCSV